MLYHLSTNKNLSILTPRIPECAISIYENTRIKRVCFSDSIDGCLSALQNIPTKYYVYVPYNLQNEDIYYPTENDVRDAKHTHEIWYLNEINVKCIGAIKSFNYDYNKKYDTNRGEITVFHYPYKWIEKYKSNYYDN